MPPYYTILRAILSILNYTISKRKINPQPKNRLLGDENKQQGDVAIDPAFLTACHTSFYIKRWLAPGGKP